jgi:hypothetical protein
LGLVIGLHFPDIDNKFQGVIPSHLLLHRSILTHGMIFSLILFSLVRRRRAEVPSFRLFATGLSLALAVHLCFDFFPRGWAGFALIHIPVYGRTTALFSQSWIILSMAVCLYLGFARLRNMAELVLGFMNLIISFAVSAVENGRAVLSAFMLLAFATGVTVIIIRQVRKSAARRA